MRVSDIRKTFFISSLQRVGLALRKVSAKSARDRAVISVAIPSGSTKSLLNFVIFLHATLLKLRLSMVLVHWRMTSVAIENPYLS